MANEDFSYLEGTAVSKDGIDFLRTELEHLSPLLDGEGLLGVEVVLHAHVRLGAAAVELAL